MTTQSIPVSPQLKALISCQVKAKVLIMTCVTPRDPTLLPLCPHSLCFLIPQMCWAHFCLRPFTLPAPSTWMLSPQDTPMAYPLISLTSSNITSTARLFLTILFRTTAYPAHSSPGTPPFYITMLYFSPIMSKLFLLMYFYWVKKTLPIMIYPCPNPWYLHI